MRWPEVPLGEICELVKGKKPSQLSSDLSDPPYMTAKAIRGLEEPNRVSPQCKTSIPVRATDVVIIMDGSNSGEVFHGLDGILASTMGIVKHDNRLIPSFLMHFLTTHREEFAKSKTGAAIPHLDQEAFAGTRIPVPPLSEQQRVVTKLDAAFAALAEAQAHVERNRANARELFESYLNGVFEVEGSEWPEHEMGQVCEVKDGTHDSPTYLDSGIPFVTQKNVTHEGLSLANTRFISQQDHDNFYRRSNAAKGDVLISMIGANRGMACLVDDQPVFSIKNVGLVKRNKRVNERFLLAYLKSRRASDFVKTRSKGGAQEFIGLTELRKFPVPIPDRKKQDSVADELEVLRLETKQLESTYQQKLLELEGLKKGLLGAAFRGEL